VRIARIRRLLGDTIDAPRFIANVHGEGYRFIPPRDRLLDVPEEAALSDSVVGREQDSVRWQKRSLMPRQVFDRCLFITGEAGIGKMTVIDEFVGRTGARARIGRDQCIEHYGMGEPYLPVMEALTDLGRHDESASPRGCWSATRRHG
jgi:hypothetical protein